MIIQFGYCFKAQLCLLQLSLLGEYALYKLEDLKRFKLLLPGKELTLFDHFQVEDVVDEAEQKVHLRDNNLDYLFLSILHVRTFEKALKEH